MSDTEYVDLARQLFEAADRECPNWREMPVFAVAMRRIENDLAAAARNPDPPKTFLDDLDALKRALAQYS